MTTTFVTNNAIQDLLPLQEDAAALLQAASKALQPDLALASSFSAEDIVILDLLAKHSPAPRVIAIDTGRLPEETYQTAERLERHYDLHVEWLFPNTAALESLLHKTGPYSFYLGLEQRQACCQIRKVEPLDRALATLQGWITGQRRSQAASRANLDIVEIDIAHASIVKLNPLAAWSEDDVHDYIRQHNLPTHPWYEKGYRSIGCAPCTRPVQDGGDIRSGRWWWEDSATKECGLHNTTVQPNKKGKTT